MAEALRERAQRIYEKYGNVMLETAGMTKAGIERKATCRALFSKILYLAGQPAEQLPEQCSMCWTTLHFSCPFHLHLSLRLSCAVGAESEKILEQESGAAQKLSIPKIFGATDEDTDGLRIVSLYEVGLFCLTLSVAWLDVLMELLI